MSIKISVITPSFNQSQFLEATLQSVIGQNYSGLEYIVVDGGSTDDTLSILRKHDNHLAYWVSEKDGGQSQAFNKGLQRSTGEIIGWLNSDDLYLGNSLEKAARYFQEHEDIDVVFTDYMFIDENGTFLRRRKEIPFRYDVYLWTGDCYHANCAGFFRRRLFDRIGGLDEKLHFGMDYDFYMRAARANCRFGHLRDYWGAYRLHKQSKSVSMYGLQLRDANLIGRRYRPDGVSELGAKCRKIAFTLIRIGWKVLLGSYLPIKTGTLKVPL